MMIKTKVFIGITVLAFVLGGCGNANNGANEISSEPTPTSTALEQHDDVSNEELLIIIDQTEKPIEGGKGSFDFVVKKRPEGYALTTMEWSSANHHVENSLQEAIQHGADGEDGFYISGNGQFMGFFYDSSLAGEKGEVTFTFSNEQGDEVKWSKEITLL